MAGRIRREGSDALIVFPTSLAAYPLTAASASAPATSWIQVALVSPVEPRGIDITADDLRQMAENFRAGKYPEPPTRICVDYEHLSLKPSKPGDGKAAGWIVALELRHGDAELWAQVEWTPAGAEAVRSREYQFISPVIASGFITNAGEQIGTTLLNAALTNNPQLQGMAPVALTRRRALAQLGDSDRRWRVGDAVRDRFSEDLYGEDCWLVELYGDSAVFQKDGRYYQIAFAIDEHGQVTLSGDAQEVVATFTPLSRPAMKLITLTIDNKSVQVPEEVLEQTDLVTALRAQVPPAGATVVKTETFAGLQAQVTALSTQVETLSQAVTAQTARADAAEQTLKTDRAKATVDALVRAGKLTPAQRPWAEAYCLADAAGFETFAQTLTVVVPLDREHGSAGQGAGDDADAQLDAKAREILAADLKLGYYGAYELALKRHPDLYALSVQQQEARQARGPVN